MTGPTRARDDAPDATAPAPLRRSGGRNVGGLLLAVAGTGAYLMPGMYVLTPGSPQLSGAWWVAYLVGLVLFVVLAFAEDELRVPEVWLVGGVVLAAAVAFLLDPRGGVSGVPLSVAAATVGLSLARPWVVGVCVGYVALIAVVALRSEGSPSFAFILTTMYAGLVVFAAVTGYSSASERRLREQNAEALAELTAAHEELRAARDDLAEASRAAERLRISRELHDLVGHQLAGLAVHLEVASHLTDGQAAVHVEAARGAAKSLLGDVRAVVARLRDDEPTDLVAALAAVADAVPHPRVVVATEGVGNLVPGCAHVVLRCVQEGVTNAVRHAGAGRVDVLVRRSGGEVLVEVHDDGRGADGVVEGNGLRGMRERVDALGGNVEVVAAAGVGLVLRVRVPLDGCAETRDVA
ncbi:sensor histidine kinase [Sanguibacter sp. HDW7]|uniref:sensor histidine kinase n=1 Tax=Sanguibacter sp. HDW7 TaxID=2714931 RepID=UPI001407C230|nr:histidine kinase [Sanguibacter sp. HDW7]QIK83249.1 sensor histidine kinase [Sanguibacter sp. HDW7]